MDSFKPSAGSKIKVFVSPDLEDLIPAFLQHREQDIKRLEAELVGKNFSVIQTIGHDLRGTGGGYGFPALSMIGERLEEAASQSDLSVIKAELKKLKDYLASVEVIYSENPEEKK